MYINRGACKSRLQLTLEPVMGGPKCGNSGSFQLIVLSQCVCISSVFQRRGGARRFLPALTAHAAVTIGDMSSTFQIVTAQFFREALPCFYFRL